MPPSTVNSESSGSSFFPCISTLARSRFPTTSKWFFLSGHLLNPALLNRPDHRPTGRRSAAVLPGDVVAGFFEPKLQMPQCGRDLRRSKQNVVVHVLQPPGLGPWPAVPGLRASGWPGRRAFDRAARRTSSGRQAWVSRADRNESPGRRVGPSRRNSGWRCRRAKPPGCLPSSRRTLSSSFQPASNGSSARRSSSTARTQPGPVGRHIAQSARAIGADSRTFEHGISLSPCLQHDPLRCVERDRAGLKVVFEPLSASVDFLARGGDDDRVAPGKDPLRL